MNFSAGRCLLELAQEPACVALTLHNVGSSTPFGVTFVPTAVLTYTYSCQCLLFTHKQLLSFQSLFAALLR